MKSPATVKLDSVQAGDLQNKIESLDAISGPEQIIELDVSGDLNNTDLAYIQMMTNLRVLELPVTELEAGALSGFSSLVKVKLPNVTSIGDGLFTGCSQDIELSLGGTVPSESENLFTSPGGISTIIVPDSVYRKYDANNNGKWLGKTLLSDGVVVVDSPWSDSGSLEDMITTSGGITTDTQIKELYITAEDTITSGDIDYIKGKINLEILDVSDRVSVGDVGHNFLENFKYLRKVKLPARSFGNNAFSGCHQLKDISLTYAESFGDNALSGCKNIEEINLPVATDFGERAFARNSNMRSINLPKARTFGEDAFENCYKLRTVNLPRAREFDQSAFEDCYSLKEIDLPEAESFARRAFKDCYSLETIIFPVAESFGEEAFEDCYNLENIDLPEARIFGQGLPRDCYKLKQVNLPEVRGLEGDVFRGGLSKITLTLGENIPTLNADLAFSSYDPLRRQAVLQVPASVLNAYDGDPQDPSGLLDDGLWFGWKLEGIDDQPVTEPETKPSTGGGSSPSYYSIRQKANIENGEISFDQSKARKGSRVTIRVSSDKGYRLDTLRVLDERGKEVEFTQTQDGEYTFIMPSGDIEVEALFVQEITEPEEEEAEEPEVLYTMNFTDIKEGAWYYGSIGYINQKGLMRGTASDRLSPNTNTSRAMIVTILYRLEKNPKALKNQFKDVAPGTWYADAVSWAGEKEVVSGYGNELFGPNDDITREQLIAVLYNYAKYKGYDTSHRASLERFADNGQISSWARQTMNWGVGSGMIKGKAENTLNPKDTATRAELAAILERFIKKYS